MIHRIEFASLGARRRDLLLARSHPGLRPYVRSLALGSPPSASQPSPSLGLYRQPASRDCRVSRDEGACPRRAGAFAPTSSASLRTSGAPAGTARTSASLATLARGAYGAAIKSIPSPSLGYVSHFLNFGAFFLPIFGVRNFWGKISDFAG